LSISVPVNPSINGRTSSLRIKFGRRDIVRFKLHFIKSIVAKKLATEHISRMTTLDHLRKGQFVNASTVSSGEPVNYVKMERDEIHPCFDTRLICVYIKGK